MLKLRIRLGAVVAGPLLAMVAGAQGRNESVAIVADYQPASARLSISRAGQPVPLTIGTQVFPDDTVELSAGNQVMVTTADGTVAQIAGPGKNLRLAPASARSLGVLSGVLASLQGYFGEPYRAKRIAAAQGSEDCVGRRAIEVPLFGASAAIVAGTRDLRFAWAGGCGPFTITVRDAASRELARVETSSRTARFRELALSPGRVVIEIRDKQQTLQVELQAAAAHPAFPPELATEAGPLAVLGKAHWLAGQDAGRWKFESFELLAPLIRAGDPLASNYGDVLMWGAGGPGP